MNRVAVILVISVLAGGAYYLWLVLDRQRRYEEVLELMQAARPYKEAVGKALLSKAPIPSPASIPRQARAMSARPDGTILIEVSDDIVPGARLTLRPETFVNGEYLWTCRGEGLRYAPAACR